MINNDWQNKRGHRKEGEREIWGQVLNMLQANTKMERDFEIRKTMKIWKKREGILPLKTRDRDNNRSVNKLL